MRMLKPAPAPTARRPEVPRTALRLASPVAETPAAAPQLQPTAAASAAAPVQHAQNWMKLVGEAMARYAATGASTAALLPLMRADTGSELLDLQFAVIERMHQLQQDWWQGWAGWIEELGQSRKADTLSEHIGQQYNLGEQFAALLKSQAADLLDLHDNVQVNYGYWATRKLARQAG